MDYQRIYEVLFQVSKMAGVVALDLQSNITNEGKQVSMIEDEDQYHKAMREAKTKVDVLVQEMFLQTLYPQYGKVLSLDVEEESATIPLYTNTSYEYTLVLDPIDGTLDYIAQKDTYSICSAILHEQDVKVAIVYFPARDELYGYYEGQTTRYYHHIKECDYDTGICLDVVPRTQVPKIIYKNARLSQTIVNSLVHKGFEVIDDAYHHLGCPDAILKCMKGEALAYFADTRNIRDILLGAILSKMQHGGCYDYHGDVAVWQKKGRQKEIVFSIYGKKEIF